MRAKSILPSLVVAFLAAGASAAPRAPQMSDERPSDRGRREPFYELPDVGALAAGSMRGAIERYSTDLSTLRRFFDVQGSAARHERERAFFTAWRTGLANLDFDALAKNRGSAAEPATRRAAS